MYPGTATTSTAEATFLPCGSSATVTGLVAAEGAGYHDG